MATFELHDIAVHNDGQTIRVAGIARVDFTPTEVRIDLGFNLSIRAKGYQYPMGLASLTNNYYNQVPEIGWARDRILLAAGDKANAALSIEDLRPEGRASADIPFDFLLDLAEWLRFVDEEFGRLPEPAEEIRQRLRVAVDADLSPNIYGGTADSIIPQWPDYIDPDTLEAETDTDA